MQSRKLFFVIMASSFVFNIHGKNSQHQVTSADSFSTHVCHFHTPFVGSCSFTFTSASVQWIDKNWTFPVSAISQTSSNDVIRLFADLWLFPKNVLSLPGLNEVVTPIAAESTQRLSVSVPFLCFHTENGPWLIGTKWPKQF